jgi:diguanylate cyclase (GGDEF)-like protein
MQEADNKLLTVVARIAVQDLELQPMLQRITDLLRDHFDCALVALTQVDLERNRFVCEQVSSAVASDVRPGYSRPLGSGVVGRVALDREPVVVSDAHDHTSDTFIQATPGVRSEICVPVMHHGDLVSVLNLESKVPGAFDDRLPLVEAIANQIAGAISGARIKAELERLAELLEHLNAIARISTSTADVAQLLRRVTDYITQAFDVDIASIMVLDELGAYFVVEGYSGEFELRFPEQGEWPVTAGVCGRCVRLGEPVLIIDTAADPDYVAGHEEVVEEYIVPIRHGRRVLGVLNLENTHRGGFSSFDQLAYQNVAEQIAGALNLMSLLGRLETVNQSLQDLSSKDALTDIPNRRHFDEAFQEEWSRARRHDHPLAVLMIDVDHFKAYNDSLGHQAGDQCLRDVARLLQDAMSRAGETVARYGGEEFAVLLPMVGEVGARETAERIRLAIDEASLLHPASPAGHVTVSIGGAAIVPRSGGRAALLASADEALYRAKSGGRNRIEVAHH